MIFISYLLGFLTGIVISMFTILLVSHFKVPIERTIAQTTNKFKEKGEIFEPDINEERLEDLINNLPKE